MVIIPNKLLTNTDKLSYATWPFEVSQHMDTLEVDQNDKVDMLTVKQKQ